MTDITCGRCTKAANDTVKHSSVDLVRACYAAGTSMIKAEWEAEAAAEAAAELRAERWFEDRGADDGFDEWERRRGVISFSDAWDASDQAAGLEFSTRTGARL